ncbi:MAG: hypothetical protein GY832_17080 [Chloroflexi bacterium]|nr:hypothetical protein [Chloroflexota bacterium]
MKLNPSLIIGLGGTGQQAATHLKKDLLEACGGEMPPQVRLLAFDTVKTAAVKVGGRGEAERGGQVGGTVSLDYGEYVYIGGDAYDLVYKAGRGEHPQIASWLQSHFYLSKLPRNIFNLEEGAGQYRQFGRLAVFYDVRAPARSSINNMLTDTIRAIKRATQRQEGLQVFIVGSLAGGTGSGMFVDIAHIVRQIASLSTVNMQTTIRGYLVLPEAFAADVGVGMMKSLQGRAHAAMRENRRFTLDFDYKLGYPMYYHDHGDHPVWRGTVKTKLFDLLYYIDGQRARNSLADARLGYGVAPTIADAISAVLDAEDPERPFQAYPLNVEAEVGQRRGRNDLAPDAATFGSVGTYTLVFPIHSLVKSWSHQLILEVLEGFLSPAEFDAKTNLPIKLSDDANADEEGLPGGDGARRFIQATQIVDPLDVENQINLTALPAEVGSIGRRHINRDPDLMGELLDRDLRDWTDYFEPEGDDEASIHARLQARAVLAARITDGDRKINTSEENKERPTQGAPRIEEEVRNFKNVQLGREDSTTGQRSGGRYRDTLNTYATLHMERFQQALDLQMLAILNGQSRDYRRARCGKLGYLYSFLNQLYNDLDSASQVLNEIRTRRQLEDDRRGGAIAAARRALRDMKENADKKVPLVGIPSKAAHESQRQYLAKEQSLIDLLRGEIMEQAVLGCVGQMLAYVGAARQQTRDWVESLALDRHSLYSQTFTGMQEVEADRQEDQSIVVRYVVENKEYERQRYETYVSAGDRDAVRDVLGGITWDLEHQKTRGVLTPQLSLRVQSPGERTPVEAKARTDTRHNLDLLLAACRTTFERAMQDESIIDYLIYEYPEPETLAEHIHMSSGPLLNYSGGDPLPANYLRVYYDGEKPDQHNYLTRVLSRMTQLNNVGIGDQDEERGQQFAKVVNSGDRFKCSLIHTEEIIELENIEGFRTSQSAYLSGAEVEGANRGTLHLFPAEVNAVKFEDRLKELNQTPRFFANQVVIQLEKMDNFRTFTFCYAYQIIHRHTFTDDSGSNLTVWRLVLPPESDYDPQSAQREERDWWLTDPRQETHLVDAITTFNFVGDEMGKEAGYTNPIPYDHVDAYLAHTRHQDAQDRVANESSRAGSSFDYLAGELAAIEDKNPNKLQQARLFAAQIDKLKVTFDRLYEAVRGKGRPSDVASGYNFDLSCIFILILSDEIEKLKRAIKDIGSGVGDLVPERDKPRIQLDKPKKFDPF